MLISLLAQIVFYTNNLEFYRKLNNQEISIFQISFLA